MNRVKVGLLVAGMLLVAAAVGGLVGAGAAIALIKTSYNGPTEDNLATEIFVHSNILDESVRLGVRMPDEYGSDPDRRFPVLWVLDGPWQGRQIAEATRTLSTVGVAAPAIVVEVPQTGAGRVDDFTPPRELMSTAGGLGDRFLAFIEQEAIPAVGSQLRVDSTRILIGHSRGGLFAIYALIERPNLFDGYFVFSPSAWVGNRAIVPALESRLSQPESLDTFLYLSLGEHEGNRMRDGFDAIRESLESAAPTGLVWHTDVVAGADHADTPVRSFPSAARRFWGK
ncbi:MAG: alpha/beta hydrolase [Rhodothermales bacterium]|nr:alpha/beta hydrolase [Rhodothermales bacterium]